MCVYIYIYVWWRCLSEATCLIRPRSFRVCVCVCPWGTAKCVPCKWLPSMASMRHKTIPLEIIIHTLFSMIIIAMFAIAATIASIVPAPFQ